MKYLFLALVFLGLLGTPLFAEAGTCGNFCQSAAGPQRTVTWTQGSAACTAASQCPEPPTSCFAAGYAPTSASDPTVFCSGLYRNSTPELQRNSPWCAFITQGRFLLRANNNYCLLTEAEIAATRPTPTQGPAPQAAQPGDQFRCRFTCGSETAMRDGGSCTAATDQAPCIRECNTTCQGRCGGMGAAATSDAQQPQCVPVRPPDASVGGITDTQSFERLEESFAGLSVPRFLGNVIKVLMGIAGALFFFMMVYGGGRYMTAGGEPADVKAALAILKNATIGVILLALSYTIVTVFINISSQFVPGAETPLNTTPAPAPVRP